MLALRISASEAEQLSPDLYGVLVKRLNRRR